MKKVVFYATFAVLTMLCVDIEVQAASQHAHPVVGVEQMNQVRVEHPHVLIKFYKPTCPACKAIVKPFDEVARSNPQFFAVQVDATDNRNKALLDKYNTNAYPTVVIIKDRKEHNRMVGKRRSGYAQKLSKLLH